MDETLDNLICRHVFKAQELIDAHPPKLKNANKKLVYQIACPPKSTHKGELIFSRWRAMTLPETISSSDCRTEEEPRQDYFKYEPNRDNNQVEWHINFAHSSLFIAYGGPLFAQDEMQVAEHPALASLREALIAQKIEPSTVEVDKPTPILVRGVERRCAIATEPNAKQKRPFGLYGNDFARATPEAIKLATKPLNPPTITNIIAIEAPPGGHGVYTRKDIEYILITAFTGFSVARLESHNATERPTVTIHTGFWGCGAYGGNRMLMALLQILAARLARIDRLIFHTGNAAGTQDFLAARQICDRDLIGDIANVELSVLLEKIQAMEFQWGISDGN